MSVLLFRLNGVSFEEAEDIRELLETNNIDYYETSSGRWGFSVAAIWLKDNSHLETAKRLVAEYQSNRAIRIKEENRKLKIEGKMENIIDRIKNHPVLYVLTLAMILFILYFSIKPFMLFTN